MMTNQSDNKIPLLISTDMIKDALRTLPVEDLQTIKRIIEELLEEVKQERR